MVSSLGTRSSTWMVAQLPGSAGADACGSRVVGGQGWWKGPIPMEERWQGTGAECSEPGTAWSARTGPPHRLTCPLQLSLRHPASPEGGSEEAVAPVPVVGPRAEDLPGAAAAQAPEARECELGLPAGAAWGEPGLDGHPDPSRQVIGLLDVFTPATSIEDFSEV